MIAQLLEERQFGILTGLFPIPTPTTKTNPIDSASSTRSTSSPSPSTTSSSSTSTSTTSSSSSISSSTNPPPPPTVQVTTVAGQTITLTASAGGQTSAISPNPPTAPTFLQNKVLSGVVFGIVGLVGFTILIGIVTFVIKRRRNKKLLREAVMFDPVSVANFNDQLENGAMEKPSSLERDSAEYGRRPYPTPYMYPTAAPHGGVGHFQPPSAWSTPVERHMAYP